MLTGIPPEVTDSDNDGVLDENDFCPNTSEGDLALSRGCSCDQILDLKPGKDTIRRLRQEIKLYNRHTKEIEAGIERLLKSDSQIWAKIQNIAKVKGVGLMTIAKVLAETNAFALIRNGKQLTSYAGFDVVLKESGKYKGKTKISRRGNRHLRMSVFMPALSAIKSNPKMKVYYDRMLERGKPKKTAVIAVARKLLLLIYFLWLKETEYDPAYSG